MTSKSRTQSPPATAILLTLCLAASTSQSQTPPTATQTAPPATPNSDPQVVADARVPATRSQRKDEAWTILTQAAADKRSDTRIQALAALGTLPEPRAHALIETALADPDVDTRTAAILAVGQTATSSEKDLRLIGKLHALLDDKEPQVAFAAATTLWKLKDRSGEDILVAVAEGERRANATFVNGELHTANKDLHSPTALARIGAEQGASFLLGPFGFGITAYEAIRKNGGSSARVTAIGQLAEERTAPIRAELLAALSDKDPGVRAAAAKALGSYPADSTVSKALYTLFQDPKAPVRYTAAAAYLRTVDTNITSPRPRQSQTTQKP